MDGTSHAWQGSAVRGTFNLTEEECQDVGTGETWAIDSQ